MAEQYSTIKEHLAGIELDRRALAELAVSDPEAFKAIVDRVK